MIDDRVLAAAKAIYEENPQFRYNNNFMHIRTWDEASTFYKQGMIKQAEAALRAAGVYAPESADTNNVGTLLNFSELLIMDDMAKVQINFSGLHYGVFAISITTRRGYSHGMGETLHEAFQNAMQGHKNLPGPTLSQHDHLGL